MNHSPPTPPSAALILFSHGSLLCGAGETLRRHAERIAEQQGDLYRTVEVGYLNYSEPPFETAVERCRAAGARQIFVAPYFLVSGKFVKLDLPARIEENRARFPELEFFLADAVLDSPDMADAILEKADEARPPERWRDDLNSAPDFCQARSDCPLYETPSCPRGPNAAPRAADSTANSASVAREKTPTPTAPPADSASTALLVMVHGSPRPESNTDVYTILERVRATRRYGQVQAGFMECNEPDIPTAIDQCVAGGAQRVIAVPYFLHTGKHVANDLPGLLETACGRHPRVEILMSSYVGTSPRVTAVLEARAQQARLGVPP